MDVRTPLTGAMSRDLPHFGQPACTTGPHPAARPAEIPFDLSAPVPVNFVAPGYLPPETRVRQPRLRPQLADDDWLGTDCRRLDSLEAVGKQLERRRQLEAASKEFTFPPLLTTLDNMHRFIRHIQQGRQFDQPLSRQEHLAMAWLEKQTARLVAARAPYKRTVQLAMALMTVCETLTYRQVLAHLQEQQPHFFRQHCAHVAAPDAVTDAALLRLPEAMAPDSLTVAGRDCSGYLGRDDLLLYPTFASLELDDFCRLGHLPVYPVAMTTAYLLNADGIMSSPLTFALHDLGHMATLAGTCGAGQFRAERPFSFTPSRHLAFRHLLLDRLPEAALFQDLKAALTLLMFQLFHELHPDCRVTYLARGHSSFLGCLEQLAGARRENRASYSAHFHQITDSQASLAALWALRLWQHWQAADWFLSNLALHAHAQKFRRHEAPRLRQHLDFIDEYRTCLRPLFAEDCDWAGFEEGDHYAVDVWAGLLRKQPLTLFRSYDPGCGLCHLDNTDLVYFTALADRDQRRAIEHRTGARLPPDPVFKPPITPR